MLYAGRPLRMKENKKEGLLMPYIECQYVSHRISAAWQCYEETTYISESSASLLARVRLWCRTVPDSVFRGMKALKDDGLVTDGLDFTDRLMSKKLMRLKQAAPTY